MWINVWVFDSVPLINLSVLMSIPCNFYYYCSVVELEIRDGDTSGSSFIVQDCISYPGFFFLSDEIEYCPFKICEELC